MHVCKIEGRVLIGGALREVLLEVLVHNRRHALSLSGVYAGVIIPQLAESYGVLTSNKEGNVTCKIDGWVLGHSCKYDGRALGHAAWVLVQVLFWGGRIFATLTAGVVGDTQFGLLAQVLCWWAWRRHVRIFLQD